MVTLVSRLQDENRRLIKQQQQTPNSDNTTNIMTINSESPSKSGAPSDGQILQRLKTQIDKQRDEIKAKDRDLQEKNSDIENVSIFCGILV